MLLESHFWLLKGKLIVAFVWWRWQRFCAIKAV